MAQGINHDEGAQNLQRTFIFVVIFLKAKGGKKIGFRPFEGCRRDGYGVVRWCRGWLEGFSVWGWHVLLMSAWILSR